MNAERIKNLLDHPVYFMTRREEERFVAKYLYGNRPGETRTEASKRVHNMTLEEISQVLARYQIEKEET